MSHHLTHKLDMNQQIFRLMRWITNVFCSERLIINHWKTQDFSMLIIGIENFGELSLPLVADCTINATGRLFEMNKTTPSVKTSETSNKEVEHEPIYVQTYIILNFSISFRKTNHRIITNSKASFTRHRNTKF